MISKRAIGWLLGLALALSVLGAGITYLTLSLRDRGLERDFQLAQSLRDQGEYDRAEQVLRSRLERADGTESWYPRALLTQLEIQKAKGDLSGARATAQTLIDPQRKFTGAPVLEAHAFLGESALDDNDAESAQSHFQAILSGAGSEAAGVDIASLGMARIKMATLGATPEIRKELEDLIARFPDSPVREDMEYALGQCNLALLMSPIPMEGDQIYALQKGDTINTIAKKHGMPQDLLIAVNQIHNPRSLSIGRRIKVPNVDFSIVVDKSNNTLTLLNHGKFFKRYRVRTGKVDYLTPVGEFRVINKKKDPIWNDPKSGKTYPANDPENELGTRWIGFQGSSFGIHGTIRPETIGHYASNGCVGMLKEDVEELFELVREGTPIRIIGKVQDQRSSS